MPKDTRGDICPATGIVVPGFPWEQAVPKVVEQDPASDQLWDLGLDEDVEPEIDPKYHGRADLVVGTVLRFYGDVSMDALVDIVAKMLDGFDND